MNLPTELNAPVQRAAWIINEINLGQNAIMAMVGSGKSPADKQAILLSHMIRRAGDAISDDFTRITMGQLPRFEVVLRDKKTGRLHDLHTRAALKDLP